MSAPTPCWVAILRTGYAFAVAHMQRVEQENVALRTPKSASAPALVKRPNHLKLVGNE